MAKTLMLWPDITEDIPSAIKRGYSDYVDIKNLYRKTNSMGRFVRKIRSKCNLSTEEYFETWIKDIQSYDKIIIHANVINSSVPEVLRKKGYRGRIIYWYWNPVCNCVSPDKIDRQSCELWSFSKEDCSVYKMRYNSTYYFLEPEEIDTEPEIDLFFIGADKGRYDRLMKVKEAAQNAGLSVDFRIIRDRTSHQDGVYSDRMNYMEVIEKVKKSKGILEVLQDGQTGFSLRVMEGIFFCKKVISDNLLLKDEPYFGNNNFYILNQNAWENEIMDLGNTIARFINGESPGIADEWIRYFNFKSWLQRFDEGE